MSVGLIERQRDAVKEIRDLVFERVGQNPEEKPARNSVATATLASLMGISKLDAWLLLSRHDWLFEEAIEVADAFDIPVHIVVGRAD